MRNASVFVRPKSTGNVRERRERRERKQRPAPIVLVLVVVLVLDCTGATPKKVDPKATANQGPWPIVSEITRQGRNNAPFEDEND